MTVVGGGRMPYGVWPAAIRLPPVTHTLRATGDCKPQCCFTSTETRRGAQDGYLDSPELYSLMLLYFHRDLWTIRDGEAQDGHLDFHTAPEL